MATLEGDGGSVYIMIKNVVNRLLIKKYNNLYFSPDLTWQDRVSNSNASCIATKQANKNKQWYSEWNSHSYKLYEYYSSIF